MVRNVDRYWYTSFGVSVSLLDEEYELQEIIWIDLINITEYVHQHRPSRDDCKLYHTKTFCDWMKITDEKLLEQLGFYHRTHDIADSICIMLYWIHKKHEEYMQEQRRKRIMERQIHLAKHGQKLSTDEWFEMHRYIPR